MLYDDGRIDWVTLFWPRTIGANNLAEPIETELDFFRSMQKMDTANGGWKYKLSSGKDGKNHYHKIECWGALASVVAHYLPDWWWTRVSRLDWRVQDVDFDIKNAKSAIVGALRKGAKRLNVSPFHTEPRRKSDKRDVGGDGLTYGSRKSNDHFVWYVRGEEYAAFEYRIANQDCRQLLTDCRTALDIGTDPTRRMVTEIELMLASYARCKVQAALGTSNIFAHIEACAAEELGAQEVIEAMRANEAANKGKRDYWNSVAEDIPFETDVFHLNGFDQRGQVVGTQVNVAPHTCGRCGYYKAHCRCYDIFPDTDGEV